MSMVRLHLGSTWALFAAAALWVWGRSTHRMGLSPVSSDWLLDLERKSVRGQF